MANAKFPVYTVLYTYMMSSRDINAQSYAGFPTFLCFNFSPKTMYSRPELPKSLQSYSYLEKL